MDLIDLSGLSEWFKKHAIVNDNSYCWPLIKYRIQIDWDFSTSFYSIRSHAHAPVWLGWGNGDRSLLCIDLAIMCNFVILAGWVSLVLWGDWLYTSARKGIHRFGSVVQSTCKILIFFELFVRWTLIIDYQQSGTHRIESPSTSKVSAISVY